MYYKQVIVINKELHMSGGKLSAQVSHASMAFLSTMIQKNATVVEDNNGYHYNVNLNIDKDLYEQWLGGLFTKVNLAAKNENQMQKIVDKAKEFGMVEGVDFFCIRDACLTELIPDETGTRWTCIGFRPMEASEIDPITKKLQLYKD
jgi:PTH2 family peptidyl-tRNA hydrolase